MKEKRAMHRLRSVLALALTLSVATTVLMPKVALAAPLDDLGSEEELSLPATADGEATPPQAVDPTDEALVGDEDAPAAQETDAVAPSDDTADPEGAASAPEDGAVDEGLALDAAAVTPLDLVDDGWTMYTGGQSPQIVSFPVPGNSNLTGYLGASGLEDTYNYLSAASYYLRYDDGSTTTNITYAFHHNSQWSSAFYVVVYDGETLVAHNIGDVPIESIWSREATAGYPELLLRGFYAYGGINLEVRVVMTPSADGVVRYEWQVVNLSDNDIQIAAAFMIDTELQGDDHVPVYSAGTNRGMYIDTSDAYARLYFPFTPGSPSGPYDYAAGMWSGNRLADILRTFGDSLSIIQNLDVQRRSGETLFQGGDSAVFFRYIAEALASGQSRGFAYSISLGEAADIRIPVDGPDDALSPVPTAASPALPATGMSPLPFAMALACALLGVAALVSRRRLQAV